MLYTKDNPLKTRLFENLCFRNEELSYEIIEQSQYYKIERYVTRNYQRFPIYSDTMTTKRKVLSKFKKTIFNLDLFANFELKQLDLLYDDKKQIAKILNVYPEWMKIIDEKIFLENEIEEINNEFKTFVPDKFPYRPKILKETKSKIGWRIFFVPFTLGLSFLGYVSEKKAKENIKTNSRNLAKWNYVCQQIDDNNKKREKEINDYNAMLENEIQKRKNRINDLKIKYDSLEELIEEEYNEFVDLKSCFGKPQNHLKEKKGVYIIWNKTKNKYYVGQSKDLYKRIFINHFDAKLQKPKNHIFFEDWYDGDEFMVKIFFLETKDELDKVEMEYIDFYDSFKNGYNSTKGNK